MIIWLGGVQVLHSPHKPQLQVPQLSKPAQHAQAPEKKMYLKASLYPRKTPLLVDRDYYEGMLTQHTDEGIGQQVAMLIGCVALVHCPAADLSVPEDDCVSSHLTVGVGWCRYRLKKRRFPIRNGTRRSEGQAGILDRVSKYAKCSVEEAAGWTQVDPASRFSTAEPCDLGLWEFFSQLIIWWDSESLLYPRNSWAAVVEDMSYGKRLTLKIGI